MGSTLSKLLVCVATIVAGITVPVAIAILQAQQERLLHQAAQLRAINNDMSDLKAEIKALIVEVKDQIVDLPALERAIGSKMRSIFAEEKRLQEQERVREKQERRDDRDRRQRQRQLEEDQERNSIEKAAGDVEIERKVREKELERGRKECEKTDQQQHEQLSLKDDKGGMEKATVFHERPPEHRRLASKERRAARRNAGEVASTDGTNERSTPSKILSLPRSLIPGGMQCTQVEETQTKSDKPSTLTRSNSTRQREKLKKPNCFSRPFESKPTEQPSSRPFQFLSHSSTPAPSSSPSPPELDSLLSGGSTVIDMDPNDTRYIDAMRQANRGSVAFPSHGSGSSGSGGSREEEKSLEGKKLRKRTAMVDLTGVGGVGLSL